MLHSDGGPPTARNVFIIEDDRDDAFLLKRALEAAYARAEVKPKITHLENGLDAIYMVGREDLLSNLPDIIIVDLNMPVMNGVRIPAVASRRLEHRYSRHCPYDVRSRGGPRRGARGWSGRWFVKPDTQAKLVAIVRTIVDRYAPAVCQ